MPPLAKPIRRTCRPFSNGEYYPGEDHKYMLDHRYAQSGASYIRSYLLILNDLRELFDYIEPADANHDCYSHRLHSLLLRACVEVEANLKAILKENGYTKPPKKDGKEAWWDMSDYRKVEKTHHLSGYEVRLPVWEGIHGTIRPFAEWGSGANNPDWYAAYNATKHDRHKEFRRATLRSVVAACGGLCAILYSQFCAIDLSVDHDTLSMLRATDGPDFLPAIGNYFSLRYPRGWSQDDHYDFNWGVLRHESDPFTPVDYTKL